LKFPVILANIVIVVFLIINYTALSQKIITLPLQGLNGPNGIGIDFQGWLYVANEPGKRVLIFDRDNSLIKIIQSDSPDGIAFDSGKNIYISNFYSGLVMKYDVHGQTDTLVHLLGQPADVRVDRFGNIYVSEFNLDRVSVIDKNGDVRVFADGITKPFGLACDNEGNLYVASNTTGQIFKCSRNEKKLLATVPGSVAYITYSEKTGNLYATCFTGNSIYRIKKSGEISRFAGTGAKGGDDGDIAHCTFDGPNSITLSPQGDIYISEFPANRIRKIVNAE